MVRSLIPWAETFPRSFNRFEREFEKLMERFFAPDEGTWMTGRFMPTANVAETETAYEVSVELPGMKPQEFQVEMKNGELWITGEKKEEKEEKGKTFHRVERHYGEFRRVISLPTPVAEEKIEARYNEGVLTVTVPKTEEAKTRHIEVKHK